MVCLRFLWELAVTRNIRAMKPDFGNGIRKKLKAIMPKPVKMRVQYLVGLWVVILKITNWSIGAMHAVSPWIMASLNIIKYPIWVWVKSIQL